MFSALNICLLSLVIFVASLSGNDSGQGQRLNYESLPNLPDEIGVAGPVVGVSNDTLVVAGGANFAKPDDPELWNLPKRFLKSVWLLKRDNDKLSWTYRDTMRMTQPVAYSSVVTTDFGILVMGGESSSGPTNRAFLLQLKMGSKTELIENDQGVPDLPMKATAGGAAILGDYVYVVAGQIVDDEGVAKGSRLIWRGSISKLEKSLGSDVNKQSQFWEPVASWPAEGNRRMHCQVAVQHDGFGEKLYVVGGRRFEDPNEQTNLLTLQGCFDSWKFSPKQYDATKFDTSTGAYSGPKAWTRIADSPEPITAGTSFAYGPAHIIFPTGTSLEILHDVILSGKKMSEFRHPGFPRTAYAYHTVTNTWTDFGPTPVNPVTTPAVKWRDEIFLVSGELRPRVRTNEAWLISVNEKKTNFGVVNQIVVAVYLLGMLMIGVVFARHNQTTDHYFRGGKAIPWWVAGCSIFATMLSSITYMAVPAKAFAQDWVYWIGSFLILAVAPIAVYIALPFFRKLDATSAYEYLEKRFNRTARLIGSGCFTLFHVFRMGIVLALAALALSSVTSLSSFHCVLVMGVLSTIYCTLGGMRAVVWTDTIQTFVLLFGAILCLAFAWFGSELGSFEKAIANGKLHMVNFEFGSASFTTMALWVVILGGIGQNVSSYTADQAVVQRYMTTSSQALAAKSIWLNAWMAIPASAIFFAVGTAIWMFYQSNPSKLDPNMAADRIMPYFISHELPVGIAGLVVAGIFAAAQSTVSTSMNSGATTIITDFFRSNNQCVSKNHLRGAQVATFVMGACGTLAGIMFIDPGIKSLFDQFIGVLGIFLGVLTGLFMLGVTTRRASAVGSLLGAIVATIAMFSIVSAANNQVVMGIDFRALYDAVDFKIYNVSSYLYALVGITVCFVVGLAASLLFPNNDRNLAGLTLWTLNDE